MFYFSSAAFFMSRFSTIDEPRSVIGAGTEVSRVSIYYRGVALRAIDRNTADYWNRGSVMHICNNTNPW